MATVKPASNAPITARRVNQLGTDYVNARVQWGENNMVTQRAFAAFVEARAQWERVTGRTFGTKPGRNPPGLSLWLNDGTSIGTVQRFETLEQVREYVAKMRPRVHPKPGGDVVVVRKGRAKLAEFKVPTTPARARPARASNPGILVVGVNRSRLLSRAVEYIEYRHVTEGARFHEFGPGVRAECLKDGSVRLFHPTRRLWFDDGE